jgi:Fe-S cluster biogenesis protein NfuA
MLIIDSSFHYSMKDEILKALESMRPFLQSDNGDVELVDVTEDGIVKVKLLGECKECPLSVMTLRAGIERSLMQQVPGVRRIEAVK